MKDRLDMMILDALMDDDKELIYLWSSANFRKDEDFREREKRLAKGEDVDFSKAAVVLRVMRLWLEDGFLHPYDTALVGNSYLAVELKDIEFDKLHCYYWEITSEGRAEVDRPEYDAMFEEMGFE